METVKGTFSSRERFLMTWLPGCAGLFDLLADFRFGGYRILSDLICDIDDENTARNRKRLIRERDSPTFVSLMEAYHQKTGTQTYRETASSKCWELLDGIVKPVTAVRYVVALGKRDLLWELLPDAVPPMCWRCAMVNEWSEFLQYTGTVTYATSGKRDTSFGRKYLRLIPGEILERPDSGFGICRYRVRKEHWISGKASDQSRPEAFL